MGLAGWALGRIKAPLGSGFKIGKLILHCAHSGPKPLRILEKVGVFVLGQVNGKAALAYYAVRIVIGKRTSHKRAARAMEVLSSYDLNDDGTVDASEVAVALAVSAPMSADKEVLRARAGYVFVMLLMERAAVDSSISRTYRVAAGRFDAAQCLTDFYSSPLAYKMVVAVRKHPNINSEMKEELTPLALEIWAEVRTRLRNDAIDFLLL